MTVTTLRRFLLSTLLMTAACGSSGTTSGAGGSGGSAGSGGSGGSTSTGGSGGSTSAGGTGGSAGTGGAADAGAGTSGSDASTTDDAGGDAGKDAAPQTDGSAAEASAPDAPSTDGATGGGTVSWTNNGTSFTVALTGTSYLQVVGTAPNAVPVVNLSGVINGTNGFPKNSISFSITGPTGDGSLPAGTYNCDKFGTKTMGATLDGAGSANNLVGTGGSCAVVFPAAAVNGHAIAGTFTGSLIGIAGTGGTAPTNMTITAGSFSYTDTP
jgi:hypothetical protein